MCIRDSHLSVPAGIFILHRLDVCFTKISLFSKLFFCLQGCLRSLWLLFYYVGNIAPSIFPEYQQSPLLKRIGEADFVLM